MHTDTISFEWDLSKAQINEIKHKVSFLEATTVFSDERAILFDDPDHSMDEDRFLLIGMSEEAKLLIVCHCYRVENDVIRIISARMATKKEEEQYINFNKGW